MAQVHYPMVFAARVAWQAARSPSGGQPAWCSKVGPDMQPGDWMRRVLSSACMFRSPIMCLCSAHARFHHRPVSSAIEVAISKGKIYQ